jgi:hypothetical protein
VGRCDDIVEKARASASNLRFAYQVRQMLKIYDDL